MTDNYQKRDSVYKQYQTYLFKTLNDILDSALTGGEINDRLGLFTLFHLMVQMRNENYASCRPLASEIDCMSDVLFCNGVDTTIMEDVFPPSYNDENGEEWTDEEQAAFDGIGYMQIPVVDPGNPTNRVR